ncbi:type II toxin-antitoxin system PemK/MazF family toxin [Eubacterium sp. MSJ-13]|uniref:type II toxin-antitoxin system PemK/MazF family toxin n=1 Tax=Eubacterium sp. MSJ-13 TaxID=2841513 RepID=UPI001C1015A8|nr:type II toxin-antitoxin system PemK/MazF family toxin [Eubacterium sp. MSJ-13]MBU5477852.1 type II toxin-antitoxin system PemK/MazF family toxin [Eubacterium sp. MSJ-13]
MKIELVQAQKMLEWLKTKLYLDALSDKAKTRAVKRGQVYRCNFGCGIGSEMQKDRPAVIIQNNVGNNRSGNTIVIPITHDTSILPCVANITPQTDIDGNTILDGQANASNMMCISKARLGDYVCSLTNADMRLIDEAIAKTVGLMGYYADLTKKLNDKLEYITRIKDDRNKAQDELAKVRKELGLSEGQSIINKILELKKSIDN